MKCLLTCFGLLLAASLNLQAEPWIFSEPLTVTPASSDKVFHHLESSGRRNIAVSAETVALAWEDDRDASPRIYLARKKIDSSAFSRDTRLSGKGDAFEPGLVALDNNRFAVAWEENARIHLRIITPTELGPVIVLGNNDASQPGLALRDQQLLLVYSQRDGRFARVWMQGIEINDMTLQPGKACPVDAEPAQDDQLYPTAISLVDRIIVAWEDRRPGHTIIMAAQNADPESCRFSPPQRISDDLPDQNATYGKGHGVARVALAQYDNAKVLAAWADKRDFAIGSRRL